MLANLLSSQSSNLLGSGLFGGNTGQQQQSNQAQNQQGGGLLGSVLDGGLLGGNNSSNNQNQTSTGLLGGIGSNGASNVSNPLFGGKSNDNQQSGGGLFGGMLGNNQGNSNQNSMGQNPQTGGMFGGLLGSNNQAQPGGKLFGDNQSGNTQMNGTSSNGLLGGGNNNGASNGFWGSNSSSGPLGSSNGGGLLGSNNSGGLLGSNNTSGNLGANGGGLLGGMSLLGGSGLSSNVGGNNGQDYGTLKTPYKKTNTGKDGSSILAINAMKEYKGNALDELRIQDYQLIKNANSLPDNVKQVLQSKMQGATNVASGGSGLLGTTNIQNQQPNAGLNNQSSGLFNTQNNQTNQQNSGLLGAGQGIGLLGQGQTQQQNQQGGGGLFNNGNQQQQNSGLLNLGNNQQQNTSSSNGGLFNSLQQPQGNNGNSNTKGAFGGLLQNQAGGLLQNQAGGQGNQSSTMQNAGNGGLLQNLNQGGMGGQGLLQQQQGAMNTLGGANNMQQGQANAMNNNTQAQANSHLFTDSAMQMPDLYNMQMQMMNQFMSMMMQNQMNVPQAVNKPQQDASSEDSNTNLPSTSQPETTSYSLKSLGGKISDTFRSPDFQKSIFSSSMKYNVKHYSGPRKQENSYRLKRKESASKLSQAPRNSSLIMHKAAYKPSSESLQFMFKRSEEEENYRGSNKSSTQSSQQNSRYSRQSVLGLNETINIREIRDIHQNFEINVLFNDAHEFGRQHKNLYKVRSTNNTKISELKRRTIEKIFGERQNAGKEFTLIFKGVALQEEQSVSDYNIRHNDRVELVTGVSEQNSVLSFSGKKVRKESLAPEVMVPKLTKKGYNCEPSLTKMFRMNEEELSSVSNFTVFNEFGKITFEEPVDLRGVNIDEIITINHKTIEVYPENYENIPKLGQGLNKPATVIFYQWGVPQKYAGYVDEYQNKLKKWAGSIQAQFLYFKPEKQEVSIKIASF